MKEKDTHPAHTPPSKPSPLEEGLDYYIDKGRWVFTAHFLLKRGECCGSGCRHCPYGHKNVTK
ncbi:MAG TPA: DUF5522 domain-containing protein [Saprospiraceae bacterium]|nr:DUF5522 domain-containing protein [Saprospiraceae bacterium]HPI08526.1 DUF5522 domain-containing protein [Saprospiraceae bacterium]